MPDQKIQKALADAGVGSRRAVEALVAAGRVEVNGRRAEVGERVDPERDRIVVDGRPLARVERRVYLALAKPAGVTSTVSDRHADRTVLDLVPRELRSGARRLYPVGRLDRDSEGLLLLTNDGEWADRVLHPRYGVEREYAVGLSAPLDADQVRGLREGVPLEEGLARLVSLRPATGVEVDKLERAVGRSHGRLHWYRATLSQGWRRQLRRMFADVGAPIERLVRVRIGPLWLDDLRLGEVRPLTAAERQRLERGVAGDRRSRRDDGLVVTLDGPASSGKSTVGAGAAAELGYRFCDTGLLYRALTFLALQRGVDPSDPAALVTLVPQVELAPDSMARLSRVEVDGVDVTDRVRTPEVDRNVSEVSKHRDVREALLPIQRRLAAEGRIIMAGRDIGSVVLPDADVKLYLDVSVEERARRRAEERGVDPEGPDGRRILEELRRRDELDTTRATSPLRIPDRATIIRSDGKRLEETVAAVADAIRRSATRRHR